MSETHKYHLENKMYETTDKSVTIVDHENHANRHSLQLQTVKNKKDGSKLHWLAWYDKDCKPKVSGGSVFDKTDIPIIIEQLAKLLQEK